jgi:hypothetical protein
MCLHSVPFRNSNSGVKLIAPTTIATSAVTSSGSAGGQSVPIPLKKTKIALPFFFADISSVSSSHICQHTTLCEIFETHCSLMKMKVMVFWDVMPRSKVRILVI